MTPHQRIFAEFGEGQIEDKRILSQRWEVQHASHQHQELSGMASGYKKRNSAAGT